MTIKEVEERTGLTRSNIRFYEKEKLIAPSRNEKNSYREFTEEDVENLKRIAYLCTLGISIENLYKIVHHETALREVLDGQEAQLEQELVRLKEAKQICRQMLADESLEYDTLDIEAYVPKAKQPAYWRENRRLLGMDTVGFVWMWSKKTVWNVLCAASLLLALLSFPFLPEQIPVQWSGGFAAQTAGRYVIFCYPLAILLVHCLLRPFIWRTFGKYGIESDETVGYTVNFLCFAALSVQGFTLLYVQGWVRHVEWLLLLDAIVFLGIFSAAWYHIYKWQNGMHK